MRRALNPETTTLIVMDVQERLVAAMPDEARSVAVDNVIRLVQGARILGASVLVTEQYPAGLGNTIATVDAALSEFDKEPPRLSKVDFNACQDGRFADALESVARGPRDERSVILCGMETHICVYQTARQLAGNYEVHVPYDATCCRRPENHRIAEHLLDRAGAVITTTETALFELLGRAGSDEFKAISKLVR